MTEPLKIPQKIYERVYVIDRDGSLVMEGQFLENRKYDFVVLDEQGGEQLFRNYSHSFECAEAVDQEATVRQLKKELQLLSFAISPKRTYNVDDLLPLVEKLTEVISESVDLDSLRSLLRTTAAYPVGKTSEDRKVTIRDSILKECRR